MNQAEIKDEELWRDITADAFKQDKASHVHQKRQKCCLGKTKWDKKH